MDSDLWAQPRGCGHVEASRPVLWGMINCSVPQLPFNTCTVSYWTLKCRNVFFCQCAGSNPGIRVNSVNSDISCTHAKHWSTKANSPAALDCVHQQVLFNDRATKGADFASVKFHRISVLIYIYCLYSLNQ